MVVASPQPSMPSEKVMCTNTKVCVCMVVTDNLCGLMVGNFSSRVSIE